MIVARTILRQPTRVLAAAVATPRRHIQYKVGGSLFAAAAAGLVSSLASDNKAPSRDVNFVLNEVLDAPAHYAKHGFKEVTPDLINDIIGNFAKFSENVLSPINQSGDIQGCVLDKNGDVKTPKGFKEAYAEYAAGGWQGMTVPEAYGGMNLPLSLGLIKSEMVGTANWSWGMYPGLSVGCMNTLILHASEEQKKTYLTKLAEGSWLGTMCLTEPHCGTDLGQMTTKAARQADGTFKISGTKCFISCGEHDFGENIVHIVLARIEGAPAGLKGISLFIVPKYVPQADGSLATKKNLTCGGIEKKMGIHGSSTCIMNFDGSTGYLIGAENRGLHQMFTFMNTARIGTALQGVGAAELAYQGALPYAIERRSLRSLSGTKEPEQAADAIIHHGDVRRMLLTMKAIAEGGRCMMYHTSLLSDQMLSPANKDTASLDDDLGFLTPILKGFLTEAGTECASLGMQVWGGHGFIRDNGMEQNLRDARISTMYEGTTGIQALDLLGRKILLTGGKAYRKFMVEVLGYCKAQLWDHRATSAHKKQALALAAYTLKWGAAAGGLALQARSHKDVVSSASVDFMMYSGYVSMAYYWLRMMDVAHAKLQTAPNSERDFYTGKIKTGEFYFEKLLPRANGHLGVLGSNKSVMKMKIDEFQAAYK